MVFQEQGLPVKAGGPFLFGIAKDHMRTTFTDRMYRHWTQTLGLAGSKALTEGWHQLERATAQLTGGASCWQVLQLPTGTGKTEALKILCSLQDPIHCRGILIVTRFRAGADELAEDINRYAFGHLARSVHQEAPGNLDELRHIPVLITTHAAYRLALQERVRTGSSVKIDRLQTYLLSRRDWLVVDEALDWIDSYSLDVANLRSMSGDLTVMQCELSDAVGRLGAFLGTLTDVELNGRSDRVLSTEHFRALTQIDLAGLKDAVAALPTSMLAKWIEDQPATETQPSAQIEKPLKARYLEALDHLIYIVQIGHAWTSRRQGQTLLHSSRSLLGADEMHGIILDATADVDPTYAIARPRLHVLPRPRGMRNYRNVTLHISPGHPVGKRHLARNAKAEWATVWGGLSKELVGKRTLVCAHKHVIPDIKDYVRDHDRVLFTNWGNIDGRNDWHSCAAAVLFGLPYLDDITPALTFIAEKGRQSDDWFTGTRQYEEHADIRSALNVGFIARSVVQAINRTHCRKAVDAEGNCEPTDIYLLLPTGTTAAVIVAAIEHQMPGIRVKSWEAGATKRKARKVPTEMKLATYFETADLGPHLKSEVVRSLRISVPSFERMIAKLRDRASAFAQNLERYGVTYHSQRGRGKEAYFIKH